MDILGEIYVWGGDRQRARDLMLIFGLIDRMHQFVMESNVCWYGYVLRREDGHVLRRALDFEVDGHRKNLGQGGHGGSRLRKNV